MLTILEHQSKSYVPRTFHNASTSDLTIAVAVNYYTGGEKLTHKAAGEKFIALPFHEPMIENARRLFIECRKRSVKVLNVAGNGIATYAKAGITRAQVNQYVYDILALVHHAWPLEKIISGGQTGADIAGIIAAYRLGIPAEATLPGGFRQRDEDGIDRDHTAEEIRAQVIEGSHQLVVKSAG
ncbi:hypothetical protein [Burkholderia phage FLC9]|nr:hypothetical protein [Burkholderia phage FLC9]